MALVKKNKSDISDATIVSETKKSPVDDLDFDKLEKEKLEVKPQETKQSTVVDLKEEKTDSSEKVVVDFMNNNNYDEVLKKKSKKAEEESEDETTSNFAGKSAEEVRQEIKNAEDQSKQNFSAKDMEEIAKVIVMVLDTSISTGLRMWSKDTSDSAYSITAEKRKMLEYQLSLILVKYQSKFSIEFMFLISLVVCYIVPFSKAKSFRKARKEYEEAVENGEIQIIETEEVKAPFRRGKGKPSK
jgi:hypothetical protein